MWMTVPGGGVFLSCVVLRDSVSPVHNKRSGAEQLNLTPVFYLTKVSCLLVLSPLLPSMRVALGEHKSPHRLPDNNSFTTQVIKIRPISQMRPKWCHKKHFYIIANNSPTVHRTLETFMLTWTVVSGHGSPWTHRMHLAHRALPLLRIRSALCCPITEAGSFIRLLLCPLSICSSIKSRVTSFKCFSKEVLFRGTRGLPLRRQMFIIPSVAM